MLSLTDYSLHSPAITPVPFPLFMYQSVTTIGIWSSYSLSQADRATSFLLLQYKGDLALRAPYQDNRARWHLKPKIYKVPVNRSPCIPPTWLAEIRNWTPRFRTSTEKRRRGQKGETSPRSHSYSAGCFGLGSRFITSGIYSEGHKAVRNLSKCIRTVCSKFVAYI